MIPAGDILDIRYDKKIGDESRDFYYPTKDKEAALDKAKDRRDAMAELVRLYEKTLDKMPKDAEQDRARRNVEFRIAFLRGRMAVEYSAAPTLAMGALKAFKEKHPNSWQISQCLQKLAELQISEKKLTDAEKTYTELAAAPVADDVKQEAGFLSARLSMDSGKFDAAQKKFEALAAKLPKNSPIAVRAIVAQAECLGLAKKTDEANKLLRQMLKESTDKNLKALAHNTLGKNLFEDKQYKEARWEFLWVDVVYNQDKAEHAKALYYLWKSFTQLGETERAQECLETLQSEQFTGTDFQRKALTDNKK